MGRSRQFDDMLIWKRLAIIAAVALGEDVGPDAEKMGGHGHGHDGYGHNVHHANTHDHGWNQGVDSLHGPTWVEAGGHSGGHHFSEWHHGHGHTHEGHHHYDHGHVSHGHGHHHHHNCKGLAKKERKRCKKAFQRLEK